MPGKASHPRTPAEKLTAEKRTLSKKTNNVVANQLRERANQEFLSEHNIIPQQVKQYDKKHKLVTRLEKPSQAIRRYYREQNALYDPQSPVYDPQQENHPGRSTVKSRQAAHLALIESTKRAAEKAEIAKLKAEK